MKKFISILTLSTIIGLFLYIGTNTGTDGLPKKKMVLRSLFSGRTQNVQETESAIHGKRDTLVLKTVQYLNEFSTTEITRDHVTFDDAASGNRKYIKVFPMQNVTYTKAVIISGETHFVHIGGVM